MSTLTENNTENNQVQVQSDSKAIKLLFTIVERGKGESVVSICKKNGANFSLISPSYGAVGTNFMDYLGLSGTEKDLVLTVVKAESCLLVMEKLDEVFHFNQPYTGITFSIPIVGVSGPLALRYISGMGGF